MKLKNNKIMSYKEKFVYFCFIMNSILAIGFIALFIAILPLTIFFPKFPELLFHSNENALFVTINIIISYCSIFNWIYCLRFWYKYDRNSLSIIPLIFPHILYAPFYFYKVNIKKRPLKMNKKVPSQEKSVIGKSINLVEYEDEQEFNRDVEKSKKYGG